MPDQYYGLFRCEAGSDGTLRMRRTAQVPATVPCPTTGRELRVATLEGDAAAICPACAQLGRGGFVSFEGDLRMAYACPQCGKFIWVAGA